MKLLIVVPQDNYESLDRVLQKESSPDWKRAGQVRILPFFNTWRSERITQEINTYALRNSPITIVLVGHIPFGDTTTDYGDLRNLIRVDGIKTFERRVLPILLQFYGLDWRSKLESSLKERWNMEVVTSYDIEEWISQFNTFGGEYNWIGEALLKILDPWSTSRLTNSLRILLEKHVPCDGIVCVNANKSASANILKNLLGKILENKGRIEPVRDIVETLNDRSSQDKPIFFFEDCLITARETISMIEALLGISSSKNQKYDPLVDRDLLRNCDLTLIYPFVTTLGTQRLTRELRIQKLDNIKLKFDRKEMVETLTPSGLEALNNGSLFDVKARFSPTNLTSNIIPVAFENTDVIEPGRRDLIISFCENIGIQLFRNKIYELGREWDDSKFGHCGLGVSGLALTLSFPHTLPKSTLPIYWLGGNIEFNGKRVHWKPLFPGVVW